MDRVDQSYWNTAYEGFRFYIEQDAITEWLDLHRGLLGTPGTLFEFGCFPGRYMTYLGQQGWEVSGMDLAPQTEDGLRGWLAQNGARTGLVAQGDALGYAGSTGDRYDLVCSFGFIEHFENFGEMIALHDRLLAPGGRLVITTPNFRGGVQNFLHRAVDGENYRRHYIPSMQPALWARQLRQLGYTIGYAGHFKGFRFWSDPQPLNFAQRIILKGARKMQRVFGSMPDNSLYSPYCGIIAQKGIPATAR